MNQKKNKSKLKIIILITITIVITGIAIINNRITENDCIGTFKIANNDNHYVEKIVLYKGGTGEGFPKDSNSGWQIEWEIKDNILNITLAYNGGIKTGFKVEKNKIISVDGEHTYIKQK